MINNEYKRAKVKLNLLREHNIGWLIDDVLKKAPGKSIREIMQLLKEEYLSVINQAPGDPIQLSIYVNDINDKE